MKWTSEHSDNASKFIHSLNQQNFSFFSGVPCSLAGSLIQGLDSSKQYYPAVREDAAIAMCSGAYLAGSKSAVVMQNSGLGYSLNVLTSFNLIYKIPTLLLITHRGLGPDAPEHWVMGRACLDLLKCSGIQHWSAENITSAIEALKHADEWMTKTQEPAAIFIQKGIFGQ